MSPIPESLAADPLQTVRTRTIALLLGGGGTGPRHRELVQSNHVWCEEQLRQPFQPVAWEDQSGIDIGNRLAERAAILSRLAVVYRSDTKGFKRNPALKRRIQETLENILTHFNPKTPRPGNWFHWQIAIPNHLGATALLMESGLPPMLLDRTRESLRFQLKEMNLEGVNAAWESRNNVYLALLEGDKVRMQHAADHACKSVRYGRNGGVREDFCYTFHGVIPYAGAYGAGFVQTVAQFIYLFEGTPWAVPAWRQELLANTLLEHSRWFLFASGMDMQVMGRSYDWGKSAYGYTTVTEAFLLLSQVESKHRGDLTATAVALVAMKPDAASTLGGFVDRLPKIPGALPSGFRYWPSGEIGAFNTDTFHVGFRQYSSRVQDYEFLTMRGAEGWNLAFGYTTIMRADGSGSWFSKDVPATEAESSKPLEIDMQHLPGTTSRTDGNPINEIKGFDYSGYCLNYGTSKFAGGAGGPHGGVAGFVLVPAYGDFQAKKSLHFFPEGFWALGSDIQSTSAQWKEGQNVNTTVLQWPCSEADPKLLSDGRKVSMGKEAVRIKAQWLWLERIAIVFTEPTEVMIRRRGSAITIWLDHGSQPKSAGYAYATLPDITLEDAGDFAKSLPVHPLRRDSKVHAVYDETRRHDSYVFFEANSCLDVDAKQPLVLYRESGKDGGILSLQDPLHQEGKLHFSAGVGGEIKNSDPAITFARESDGRSKISVDSISGRVYQFGHGPAGKNIPAQRRMDLSDYRQFLVSAESDATKTTLTVQLPPGLKQGEFELSIHGDRGHLQATLTAKDILNHPSPGVTRYVWQRKKDKDPAHSKRPQQTEGDFRVYLRTGMAESVEYFTVPRFKPDGSADPANDFRRDLDNPSRPKIPWIRHRVLWALFSNLIVERQSLAAIPCQQSAWILFKYFQSTPNIKLIQLVSR